LISKNIVVCTGHRDLIVPSHEGLIRASVRAAIRTADEMVFGGARGFDLIALKEAVTWKVFARNPQHAPHAKEHYPKTAGCNLVVIVCKTLVEQPQEVRDAISDLDRMYPGFIEYIELGMAYTPENLIRRNYVMVNRIPSPSEGYVLTYFDGKTFKSGTGSCIRYAENTKKLRVHRIAFDEVEAPPKPQSSPGGDSHPF